VNPADASAFSDGDAQLAAAEKRVLLSRMMECRDYECGVGNRGRWRVFRRLAEKFQEFT
jgi:hypothetical protein